MRVFPAIQRCMLLAGLCVVSRYRSGPSDHPKLPVADRALCLSESVRGRPFRIAGSHLWMLWRWTLRGVGRDFRYFDR